MNRMYIDSFPNDISKLNNCLVYCSLFFLSKYIAEPSSTKYIDCIGIGLQKSILLFKKKERSYV